MELPRLEPLWKKYRERGLSVIAIEATGDRKRAKAFIEKHGLSYHFLEAEEEKTVVKRKFGIKWFPTSFLVDRDDRIMICHVGFRAGEESELEKEIIELGGF